jgi:hypothetical protein
LVCLQLNSQFVWQEKQTERDGTVRTEQRERERVVKWVQSYCVDRMMEQKDELRDTKRGGEEGAGKDKDEKHNEN